MTQLSNACDRLVRLHGWPFLASKAVFGDFHESSLCEGQSLLEWSKERIIEWRVFVSNPSQGEGLEIASVDYSFKILLC